MALYVRRGDADKIQAHTTGEATYENGYAVAPTAHLEVDTVHFVLPFGRSPEELATAIAFLRTLEQKAGELVEAMEKHMRVQDAGAAE